MIVGDFPQQLATRSGLHVFIAKAGDFLIPVQYQPDPVASTAFFEKDRNRPALHRRNYVRLRYQQHGVRQITKQPRGLIRPVGTVHNHVPKLRNQQIEQASQFGSGGCRVLRFLRPSQQLQAILAGRHQALQQGSIHAMQILQRIGKSKGRPNVEMKRCVPQKRKVDQQHTAMQFLQRYGSIHRDSGGAGPAFGVGNNEYASPA